MTKQQQEDVAFWRQAAKDYEEMGGDARCTCGMLTAHVVGLCNYNIMARSTASTRHGDQLQVLRPDARAYWWTHPYRGSPAEIRLAADERATACAFLAAIIHAGDMDTLLQEN